MTGPSEIRKLDDRTVERIAAGEVVERPASAVKELVENSIDADADRVTVAVEAGGTESIRVTDDGIGMDEDTLRQAVEKHTTSKISTIEDLEGGVGTLGFRGEALHAIGAVSRMTVRSRPRDGSEGTELTVEGGEITDVSPAGCPEGTTVEITDLFYNVPARRKYLKQEATEFAHVNRVVTSYALANPAVAVTLQHNDHETFATTGTGNRQETVLAVYGREVAEAMIQLDGSDLPDGPLEGISGLVSHPETNRASRDYLSTFVNGRYVTASTVREAIVEGYGGQLGPDRYPFAVLDLQVDPATVDINVHPRKLEVRFADEEGVRNQVTTAVEDALLEEGLVRSGAPRGRSAPTETEINPAGGHAETADAEATDDSHKGGATYNRPSATSNRAKGQEQRSSPPTPRRTASTSRAESPSESARDVADGTLTDPSDTARPGDRESPAPDRKFRQAGRQESLDGDPTSDEVSFERLPTMRILGQYADTYIVAETADGLVLVDQHAADERINYERLQDSFAGEVTTQALAQPVRLELTAHEAALLRAHEAALERLGFHVELLDDRAVEVRTVPAIVAEAAGPELVRDVLAEFVSGEAAAKETVEAAANELLADLACYPSITGNTSLTAGSVRDLLTTLDACDNPYACPHGRPVIVEFDQEEIENRFERDYPGHQ